MTYLAYPAFIFDLEVLIIGAQDHNSLNKGQDCGNVGPAEDQVQDPKYGVFVPMRAFGQFGIQVEDSRRFLTKLVGTMPFFNSKTLTDYFKGLYVTRVKDRLSSGLVKSKISILEINSHLDEISMELEKQLQGEFAEFGIRVASFYVNDISVPENDPAASNKGAAGTVMGAGLGMGMGFGIGGAMGNAMGGMEPVMSTKEEKKACPACGADRKSNRCPKYYGLTHFSSLRPPESRRPSLFIMESKSNL